MVTRRFKRREVGLRRRHQGIGVGGLPGHELAALLQPHRHLGLGVRALGDGMDLEQGETGLVREDLPDRLEGGVHRAVAGLHGRATDTVDLELELGRRPDLGAALDIEADEPDQLVGVVDLVIDQGHEILVEDLLLLVGQGLEADEGIVERVLAQIVAQLLQLLLEGVAARMLAHDEVGAEQAHVLGPHDLVGLRVLEHAVLVDAALVGERVHADDRLVRLDLEAR